MSRNFICPVLSIVLLAFSPSSFSSGRDGLDAHIRAKCPVAAAWKDKHDQSDKKAGADDKPVFSPTKPGLLAELSLMAKRDQDARDKWQADGFSVKSKSFSQVTKVDAQNLPRLESIFSDGGFPTYAEVGPDGVESAWLLLQHADTNPGMQERILKTLDPKHLPKGISEKDYSLLTDRVQINQNKPQIYGTQFHQVADKWVPYPIFQPDDVDKRRHDLVLMPLNLYTCAVAAASTYKGD